MTTENTAILYSSETAQTLAGARVALGSKSKKGEYNAVAFVKATSKGKRTLINLPDGIAVDGARSSGSNANGYYMIRESDFWSQGPMRLYCECPGQRFNEGYGRPCKHIRKLMGESPALMQKGVVATDELIILWPEAIARSLNVAWAVNRIPAATLPTTAQVQAESVSVTF